VSSASLLNRNKFAVNLFVKLEDLVSHNLLGVATFICKTSQSSYASDLELPKSTRNLVNHMHETDGLSQFYQLERTIIIPNIHVVFLPLQSMDTTKPMERNTPRRGNKQLHSTNQWMQPRPWKQALHGTKNWHYRAC
jgi:hypothetical protein